LIGNSRWHWAMASAGGLRCWDGPAGQGELEALVGWAAVGPVPLGTDLDASQRLQLADVPLPGVPPWLGLDRALAGWQAHRRSGSAVLVADAGTALSLTRVTGEGCFAGGRLLAGAGLQLQALAGATAALPRLALPPRLPVAAWPSSTAEAMAAGVGRALAAAVAQAAWEAQADGQVCCLWITGGDGELLTPLVEELLAGSPIAVHRAPQLVLEALAALRPGPAR
jgi:type III pantothenate kinase